MEDAATAEISRSQVWQWIRHGGRSRTAPRSRPTWSAGSAPRSSRRCARRSATTSGSSSEGRPDLSRELFEQVALADELPEFLTLAAYDELD